MRGTISLARLAVTLRIKSVYTAGKHTLCAQCRSAEHRSARATEHFVGAATPARRSTNTLGILLTGRREAESSRIHLPSGFTRDCPLCFIDTRLGYTARREFAEVTADASISKDLRFYNKSAFPRSSNTKNKSKVHAYLSVFYAEHRVELQNRNSIVAKLDEFI